MPSSATPRNRFELQAAGENLNTWGAPKLNQDISMVDASLDGMVTTAVSGSVVLSSINYAPDQARCRFLNVTGGTGVSMTAPSVEKWYWIRNNASGSSAVTTGGGVIGYAYPGEVVPVIGNGTDFYRLRYTRIPSFTPSDDADIATKKYVDDTAFGSITNLPAQAGNGGKYITTDGTTASWAYPLNPWMRLTSASAPYTAVNKDRIETDTSGGVFTLTLPASPADGDWINVCDVGDWSINNLTIARNGHLINGGTDDLTCNVRHAGLTVVYDLTNTTWRVTF